MPFLELTLRCSQREHPRIEAALEELGALSVTFMDADAETPDERAILEPGVGAMPLWQVLVLTALFDADVDRDGVLRALESLAPDGDRADASGSLPHATPNPPWLASAQFREVADQDWVRAWMDDYPPLRFGESLWIVPWNADLPAEAQALGDAATIVRLDPGLAFGSGTHATTALCLEWLEGLARDGRLRGRRVLDVGCGSGILAIAALKLGAAHAVGVDNDPQALVASADNADRNDVAARLSVSMPEDARDARYDVVVANILASALDELAGSIAARVEPGGVLALSGILEGQHDELLARYGTWFERLRVSQRGDWLRIDGVRKMPPG